jgi:hypothetical protein
MKEKVLLSDSDFVFRMLKEATKQKYLYEDLYAGLYRYIENCGYCSTGTEEEVIVKFRESLKELSLM